MIKIGLIGCGHWGPNYIRSFQRIKGTSLEVACDLDKKKIKLIKDKYPHIKVTTNSDDIIKDASLDAVVIATPAKTHYALIKQALKSGKHVLAEKPLTVEVKQAKDLIKLAKKCKKVLIPGHIFEHHDGIKEVQKRVLKKTLGRLHYMYSRRTNLGPIRHDVNAIWDLALHDISIFNFVLNATPLKVKANGFSYLRDNLEDVGFIILYYPKNIVAHIHVSWLDPRKIREIVIVGNKKMLMFNDLDYAGPIKVYDKRVMKKKYEKSYSTFKEFRMIIKAGAESTPKVKIREPLLVECKNFIGCVKEGKADSSYLKRGLDVVAALVAAKESMASGGKTVKITT